MMFSIHYYIIFHLCFFTFINICDFAIIDKYNEFDNDLDSDKYRYKKHRKSKCEIKVITSGVCAINSQLIKPEITIETSNTGYGSLKRNSENEERMRNMSPFNIGEEKANRFVDDFLVHFKSHFGVKIDPLYLPNMGMVKFDKWGSAKIYDLSLRGISNIKRYGSIMLHTNSLMRAWSINTNLSISNITAEFKVDAKLINRVYVRGWKLQILIEKCLLNTILDFDENTKMLTISSFIVNNIEGFNLQTENLSWPFNEIITQILDHQKEQFKSIITKNAEKYMKESLKSIDITQIIEKMLKDN